MNRVTLIKLIAYVCLLAGFVLAGWYIFYGGFLDGDAAKPDAKQAAKITPFITGIVAPLFTLAGALLVIANLVNQTRQNFSSNFFNLLSQHHKLVDNLSTVIEPLSSVDKPSVKRDVFDDLCHLIKTDYDSSSSIREEQTEQSTAQKIPQAKASMKGDKEIIIKVTLPQPEAEQEINPSVIDVGDSTGVEKLKIIYNHYYHIHQSDIAHYFRNLYHIVKYVDEQPFHFEFRRQHVKILRAQLSNYEILLLAYNGLNSFGLKFKPLIEKYELLKNLNLEIGLHEGWDHRIIDYTDLVKEYPHLNIAVIDQGGDPIELPKLTRKQRLRKFICEKILAD